MATQVIIRKAEVEDIEAMVALIAQLGYQATDEEMRQRFLVINDNSKSDRILIAAYLSTVIGLVHLQVRNTLIANSWIEIVSLVINEKWRNKGIGTQLLHAGDEWAISRNCPCLQLYSNVLREQAHRFYYQNGYAKIKDSIMLKRNLKF